VTRSRLIRMMLTDSDRRGRASSRSLRGVLCAVLWVAACQAPTVRDTVAGSYVPLRGAVLELHRELAVKAGTSRIFFQDGAIVPAVNEFTPNCELRLETAQRKVVRIGPGRFEVVRAWSKTSPVVGAGHVQLAAIHFERVAGGDGDGDGQSDLMVFLVMSLHSDAWPGVRYFVCRGGLNNPARAVAPTLQEIQGAMAGYATFTLPRG
jgi:hypothetical protein